MNLITGTLRSTCEHLGCSISHLADKAGIHRSALSRILNGKDDMSTNLLDKLLSVAEVSDDDAASLAEDWTLDHWPQRAKELLIIRRRIDHAEERFGVTGVAERDLKVSEVLSHDDLDRTIAELRLKARGNPALARALRNLNRTLDGHIDVID